MARPSVHWLRSARAERISRARSVELIGLAATIPAFYLTLLQEHRGLAAGLYLIAAAISALVIGIETRSSWREQTAKALYARHQIGLLLMGGLLLSAVLPAGDHIEVLGVRLVTALLVVLRAVESVTPRLWHRGSGYIGLLTMGVLGLCGLGFWWLEPRALTYGDGLWLAFATAATVGYGDIVPTTAASKIFAVFVVLMGVAVLSMLTAAIAAMWVESEERRIEGEILRDLHRQIGLVRDEVASLNAAMTAAASARRTGESD
jgi:voltage-gated potassium channel